VAEEEKEKQIIRARRPFSTDQLGGFLCELCGSLASFAVKGFDLSRVVQKILNRKGRQERPQRTRRVLNDPELLLIRTAAGSLRGQGWSGFSFA